MPTVNSLLPKAIHRRIADNLRTPKAGPVGWFVKEYIFKGKNSHLEKIAVEYNNIERYHKVLEVAFGMGDGLKCALSKVEGGPGTVDGVEISLNLCDNAMNNFAAEIDSGKLDISHGPVTLLPFPTNYFDRVFHCNAWHYWNDLPLALSELYRVSKPNSRMTTALSLRELKILQDRKYLMPAQCDPLLYMVSLETAGFTNVGIKYYKAKSNDSFEIIQADIGDKKVYTTSEN